MGMTTTQIALFGNLRALDGRVAELIEKFTPVVTRNRTESGNIMFDVHQSTEDPDLLLCHEIWETQADLDAHLAQTHVNDFLAEMERLGYGEKLPLFPSKRIL